MYEEKQIIFHLGLSKTGTSFLQGNIFPNLKLFFEGSYGNAKEKFASWRQGGFNALRLPHEYFPRMIADDSYFEEIKKSLYDFMENDNPNNYHKFLFSFESLSGGPYLGFRKLDEYIEILKRLFNDPKIFLVIRKQDEWLTSAYFEVFKHRQFKEYYNYAGANIKRTDISTFLNCKDGEFKVNNRHIDAYSCDWLKMYQKYCEKFGKKNILVLPYEMLKNEPEKFLNEFYNFFNIESFYPNSYDYVRKTDLKVTYPIFNQKALRFICSNMIKNLPKSIKRQCRKNEERVIKFLSSIQLEDRKLTKFLKAQKLSDKQKKKIMQIHSENNKKLGELIEVNLKKYRYY